MNTFECPFNYYARKTPRAIALADALESWDYTTCNQIIEQFCKALKEAGVKPNDCIAFFPTLAFPTPLLFFACFRLRAIACPLSIYFPIKQLPDLLNTLEADFFLFPDAIKSQIPPMKYISLPFSLLFKKGRASPSASCFLNKDYQGTYLLTSGTCSSPKIACHSLGNHYYSALGSSANFPIEPSNRYLISLPLYHVAGIGLIFRTFLSGATAVFPQGKADEASTLIQSKATHLSFVPTQLRRLLKTATRKQSLLLSEQLKGILLGGGPISPSLYRIGWEIGLPIYASYGMTEMSSQICTQFEPNLSHFSLGHPLPYREISILKNREIYVRGKTLFLGYLKQSKTYHLPLDSNGWFATGDLGIYSPKKGLLFLGRKDRLFISGGENIYPEEIETHLKQIEGMVDARIEPVEDREFGKRPVAYIQSERPFREKKLKQYLESFLPKFKVPIAFYPLKELKTHPKMGNHPHPTSKPE